MLCLVITTERSIAASYNVGSGSDIQCTEGSNQVCNISCNGFHTGYQTLGLNLHCGEARECYIECNGEKCLQSANIYANNSHTFHLHQTDNASECLKNTIIYLPENGNATFTITSNTFRPFRHTNIYSGDNTQNIFIDTAPGTNCDASKEPFVSFIVK